MPSEREGQAVPVLPWFSFSLRRSDLDPRALIGLDTRCANDEGVLRPSFTAAPNTAALARLGVVSEATSQSSEVEGGVLKHRGEKDRRVSMGMKRLAEPNLTRRGGASRGTRGESLCVGAREAVAFMVIYTVDSVLEACLSCSLGKPPKQHNTRTTV